MLEVSSLSAGYNGEDVIHNISFNVECGETLCILGTNGCGKSTLLKSIARIIPYRGVVKIESQDTNIFSRKELAKKIASLGQSTQIFFPYSVWETVLLGRYAYFKGFFKNLSAEDESIAEDILKKLELWNIKDRMINELSGGQLQRVFLAKTLAQTPEIILLDEPTNHLDLKNQVELIQFLKLWVKENNKIFIGVFHDLNLVQYFGGYALLMKNGAIAEQGCVSEILHSKIMQDVYGMDIQEFMRTSFNRWRIT